MISVTPIFPVSSANITTYNEPLSIISDKPCDCRAARHMAGPVALNDRAELNGFKRTATSVLQSNLILESMTYVGEEE